MINFQLQMLYVRTGNGVSHVKKIVLQVVHCVKGMCAHVQMWGLDVGLWVTLISPLPVDPPQQPRAEKVQFWTACEVQDSFCTTSFPTASMETSQLYSRLCTWAPGFPWGKLGRATGSKPVLEQLLQWHQLGKQNTGEENLNKANV